jgi:hypothetical protein
MESDNANWETLSMHVRRYARLLVERLRGNRLFEEVRTALACSCDREMYVIVEILPAGLFCFRLILRTRASVICPILRRIN